jgi:hypothetical protein
VPDVITELEHLLHLNIETNTYQHGFMNKDSKGFELSAYNHYCQMLKMRLAKYQTTSAFMGVNNV